ncbi:biopolymer transport protein, ExbD/TolR family protein [Oceaniovalibus guishaninsula JLT2003]|uniref:Biopolymer transport protein, ExbD/TolR family protein n=1 Tax=Oceaniovalibus guishaninsula JLT2003 TaxID=1231392 RepID=K2HNK2_9RHOB|nr:protein TolR [Oceaniovalibus guishaninsula]EKE44449.1 biopolymer transport protein, ExbD/TolR family protein [Oceaniovalibus guishaninsula JLT2003]
MGAGVVQNGQARGQGRGRRGRGRAAARPMSEINVTPFVDVMLVLLIIFMVAAPLLTVGVPVQLPQTAAEALPTETEEPLTITLAADGRVLLMANETESDDLIAQLRAISAERTSRKVFLRADGTIPYSDVVQVMGALNAAGFADIGLVTDTGGPRLDGSDR